VSVWTGRNPVSLHRLSFFFFQAYLCLSLALLYKTQSQSDKQNLLKVAQADGTGHVFKRTLRHSLALGLARGLARPSHTGRRSLRQFPTPAKETEPSDVSV
jgi:hypothetical protein